MGPIVHSAWIVVLAALVLAGCTAARSTERDDPAPPHERVVASMGDEYLVVREAPGGSRASRDYVTLGASDALRDELTGRASAVDAIPGDVGVRLDRSYYGTTWWSMCLGHVDVGLFDEPFGGTNHLQSCEKSGIWLLVLPERGGRWLSVNSRGAMRPEVAAYMDALLAAPDQAPNRRLWERFEAEHRAAGTIPMQ